MKLSRSDWIALFAVIVTLIVGTPQILTFLRIQPATKSEVAVRLLSVKFEIGHNEGQPDKQFFLVTRINVRVLNDGGKTTDVKVNPYSGLINGKFEFDPDIGDYKSVENNKSADFRLDTQMNYDFITNQAYNRIFDNNKGDIEGIIALHGFNLFNQSYRYDGSKMALICKAYNNLSPSEVIRKSLPSSLIIVHYGDGLQKICGIAYEFSSYNVKDDDFF